jgi:hypothetical protein
LDGQALRKIQMTKHNRNTRKALFSAKRRTELANVGERTFLKRARGLSASRRRQTPSEILFNGTSESADPHRF